MFGQIFLSSLALVFVDFLHIFNKIVYEPLQKSIEIIGIKKSIDIHKFYSKKTVWITGASSGIGESLAYILCENDANVILSARNEEKLQSVAKICREKSKVSKVLVFPLDLENYLSFPTAYEEIIQNLKSAGLEGSIDVLINNAGISSRGSAIDTDISVLNKIMATNFYGPVELSRAVLPDMCGRRQGAIAVVSSVQGKLGLPYRSAYSASKHAVQGYFDGLRAEVADRGVSVTVASPGYVATSLSLNALNGDGSSYGKMDETTAKGLNPSIVAKQLLMGIARGSAEVLIADTQATTAIQLKAMFPELMASMMRRRALSAKSR